MRPTLSSLRLHSRSARRSALRAFTLLEILVVLAIMGLLVGLAVSKVTGILGSSETDVARMFVRTSINTGLTAYRIHMGEYPSTAEGIQALVTAPNGKTDRWQGPYIDAPGGKLPVDPWKEPYQYRYPGVKNKVGYDVYSKGPDKIDNNGDGDDIGNW